MKYEFKPFCAATYHDDLASGWVPVLRDDKDNDTPRDLHITFLPPFANWESKVIGTLRSGDVYQYTADGLFNAKAGETCLDVLMRREVEEKPKERTVHGIAYLNENGTVTAIRNAEDHLVHLGTAGNLRPVPCTITLHEPA